MEIQRYPKPLRPAVSAERLHMVEQFQRSGLTRKAFSLQYGVPLATLSWWLSKAKLSSSAPAAMAFTEVKVIPTADTAEKWAMEVESPSGVKVRCREALPVQTLERLLRGRLC
jgi:transposase-like protein